MAPWIPSPRPLAEADVDAGRRFHNFYDTRLAAGKIVIFPLKLTDLPQSCGPDHGGYAVHASSIWVLCWWIGDRLGKLAGAIWPAWYNHRTGIDEDRWWVVEQGGWAVMQSAGSNDREEATY